MMGRKKEMFEYKYKTSLTAVTSVVVDGDDRRVVEPWLDDFFRRILHDDFDDIAAVVSVRAEVVQLENQTGETPLNAACRADNTRLAEYFIEHGADVNAVDDEWWTPLLNASHVGNDRVVRMLLDNGADIELGDAFGWTPLMWAVYKKRIDVLRTLLDRGASVQLTDDDDGVTPLILAAGRGFVTVAQLLIDAGADVHAADKFGNSALLWAARKGSTTIVSDLLLNGADVDVVGMNSCTPLILAVQGNCLDIAELLLQREPNVNLVDKDGCSALHLAVKLRYVELVKVLLEHGAYVNVNNRFGDSILSSAVRSGNVEIVKCLLNKHADFNVRDTEGRTPLYLAVEKNFIDIIVALLDKRPALEVRTKDGETPLIKAVRNRNIIVTRLLLDAGAKVSAVDEKRDNCLHLSLRARSKRLTQVLLSRPNDARLLYRPNNNGETPYSIDQTQDEPILPHIFGPSESQTTTESMMGYDIYSNVLADIVCEPNLSLPLTIGLYAKWGSGKSFLLNKMKASMEQFSRSWLETADLGWSSTLVLFAAVIGVVTWLVVCFVWFVVTSLLHGESNANIGVCIFWGAVIGTIVTTVMVICYGLVYYGAEVKNWEKFESFGLHIARYLSKTVLVWRMIFYQPNILQEKDLLAYPVSFLFADYHRLSSVGGEQALAKIVIQLFSAAEHHYGDLTSRFFYAIHPTYGRGSSVRLRHVCGLPFLLWTLLWLGSVVGFLLAVCHYRTLEMKTTEPALLAVSGLLITLLLVGALVFVYFIWVGLWSTPKRRLHSIFKQLPKLRFEGFMQKLQQEVSILTDFIKCMDSFTKSQTRLVVFVDGLDNCEQDKMVQTLDAVDLLFCSRQQRPFAVVIAVDPHIIVAAVNHNMRGALAGTELTGHDYLKNIVNMPFYLHNSALRQLQARLTRHRQTLAEWRERFLNQEQYHGSYVSIIDEESGPNRWGRSTRRSVHVSQTALAPPASSNTLGQTIIRDDYFSNINPRSMQRILNTMNLTGRLMRAFEIEFNWSQLGQWVSLVEQWPYRMSWLVDTAENPDTVVAETVTLYQLYNTIKWRIPKLRSEDPLMEIDRNSQNFIAYLSATHQSGERQLTVGHLRMFAACTSNMDPFIGKLIRERQMDEVRRASGDGDTLALKPEQSETRLDLTETFPEEQQAAKENLIDTLAPIFQQRKDVVNAIKKPLNELNTEDVAQLISLLRISEQNRPAYIERICNSNLSGLVLVLCELDAVKEELQMTLGDWILFKLLIEVLKEKRDVIVLSRQLEQTTTQLSPQRSVAGASVELPPSLTESPTRSRAASRRSSITKRPARRRPSEMLEQAEAEDEQRWLFDRMVRMDTVEFVGDIGLPSTAVSLTSSRPSSVRFEDEAPVSFVVGAVEHTPLTMKKLSNTIASEQLIGLQSVKEQPDGRTELPLTYEDVDETTSNGDSTKSMVGSTERLPPANSLENIASAAVRQSPRDKPTELRIDTTAAVEGNQQHDKRGAAETISPRFIKGRLRQFLTDAVDETNETALLLGGDNQQQPAGTRRKQAEAIELQPVLTLRDSASPPDDQQTCKTSLSDDENQVTVVRRNGSPRGGGESAHPVLFGLFDSSPTN